MELMVPFTQEEISIHAPHAGSDFVKGSYLRKQNISILAPHARSDGVPYDKTSFPLYFYPRSPCGERQ